MMEDRLRASEELFGGLMDFTAGPTRGEEADRLRSAIAYMRSEFLTRLEDLLTPEQRAVWRRHVETSGLAVAEGGQGQAEERQSNQTQFVRINNNPFTAEDPNYTNRGGRGAGGTEVIQRGGAGEFHGNAQFLLKDESLNAGKRFANNKPPYQERQLSFDFGGPIIPGRLSTIFAFSNNRAENVDTIRASLPDRIFSLGITRPTTNRRYELRNTYQISDGTSVGANLQYGTSKSENQGAGGFTLPERAYSSIGSDSQIEIRQFSSLSARSIYETTFAFIRNRDETTPATEGTRINVFDAFQSGGAQNRSETTADTYTFSSLYSRLGENLTLKTGLEGAYRTKSSVFLNNFTGTYSFASLENYLAGRPLNFRVTRGEPDFEIDQSELSLFVQSDHRLSDRMTLLYGLRYNVQTNLKDYNNFDPRLALAYAVGRAAVVRAGIGIFHETLPIDVVEYYRRVDGVRQYEILIDSPSYPDPFQAGTIRQTFPSQRLMDDDLAAPYGTTARFSYERTFLTNLFFSVDYDYNKTIHRYRNRNLNASRDITTPIAQACTPGQSPETCLRPDPTKGNIIKVESTGSQMSHNLRFTYRQRFSIFNASASWAYGAAYADSTASQALVRGGGGGVGPVGGSGSDNFGYGPETLPSDNYNMKVDWARLVTPTDHTVTGTINARLPLGIFLTGTGNYNSGREYSITTGRDDNMDSYPNDRPPGVKRNSGPAQNFLSFDFNISKAIFFESGAGGGNNTRTNLNMFANMTNAFNRPNYNPGSGVMTSPNFGRSTSAGAPREFEVGMRFQF